MATADSVDDVATARGGLHVLIIGRPTHLRDNDQLLEDLYERVRQSAVVTIVRCQNPRLLVNAVREVVRSQPTPEHKLIATLDLFDHGREGQMRMGDEMLSLSHFAVDSKAEAGGGAAEDLRDYLTSDARVRLLGCRTACGPNGRQLLIDLHAWLNEGSGTNRLAYGALYNVRPESVFDNQGSFHADEAVYLFSSCEAKKGMAPSIEARIAVIMQRGPGEPLPSPCPPPP
ncbi:MAG: DUF4347 domain-containing protein [Polyangiaceae bacterium]|jgi:hypothetical protein|nr:DUF4347 domain-containing protein [Polyangiaceae bacterium]